MKRTIAAGLVLLSSAGLVTAQTTTPGGTGGAGTTAQTPATPPAGTGSTVGTGTGTTMGTGAAQSGIVTVDPKTVRVTFYTVQPTDILADRLDDVNVVNLNNETIGEIDDFVIENGRTIKAVILSVGGFLGIGERKVAVEPGSLVIVQGAGGRIERVVMNTTKDELGKAPEYRAERR